MTDRADPLPRHPPDPDDCRIWDVWLSVHHLPALLVADELGIFRLLDREPLTAAETGERVGLGPRAADALLTLLAALGFLASHDERQHLTETARLYLLPASPWYWGGMLLMARDLQMTSAFMKETLQRDRRPDDRRSTDRWKSGDLEPDRAERLTRAMHAHSLPAAAGLARSGLMAGVRRLLDVGGGSGCFTLALARAMPEMHGTILELPVVCDIARRYIDAAGLADRVATHGGDMFSDPWPPGHDGVFFSNVFHDWGEERCLDLAARAFTALQPGGRIFLHEMLLDEGRATPLAAASFSMHMMIFTEGRQFTARELFELLRKTGFTDLAARPSYGYYSLVSGRKP